MFAPAAADYENFHETAKIDAGRPAVNRGRLRRLMRPRRAADRVLRKGRRGFPEDTNLKRLAPAD